MSNIENFNSPQDKRALMDENLKIDAKFVSHADLSILDQFFNDTESDIHDDVVYLIMKLAQIPNSSQRISSLKLQVKSDLLPQDIKVDFETPFLYHMNGYKVIKVTNPRMSFFPKRTEEVVASLKKSVPKIVVDSIQFMKK